MGAEGVREGFAPSPHSPGESGPEALLFNKKHLLNTHSQCVRNHRRTTGPAFSMKPAAPPLSLQFELRPPMRRSWNCLSQKCTGRRTGCQPLSWGPATWQGGRRGPWSGTHRWDQMAPGQLCPFYAFNKYFLLPCRLVRVVPSVPGFPSS